MKTVLEFLKTSLIGGLLVLLPLLLLYKLLAEILQLMVKLATPIVDPFPQEIFDDIKAPVSTAVILIVMSSFHFGLALGSMLLWRLGLWIERTALGRLPMYNAVKGLSRGLSGAKEDNVFRPALLHSQDGERDHQKFFFSKAIDVTLDEASKP